MRDSLLIEIIIFLASISPSGTQFEELSGLSIPKSNSTIVQVADLSQSHLEEKDRLDFFATSKALAAHVNGEELTSEKLKSLPKTALACCELVGAAYCAAHGKQNELANLLADEAKSRIAKLSIEKDSDALIVLSLIHI